jgi:superfamily II DNA or RNA helicase
MRYAYINGEDSTARRKRVLTAFKEGRVDVLIANKILDEGADVPSIAFLVLAGGGRAAHRQVQRIGRGQRVSEGKESLIVVDFKDEGKYLSKHSAERIKGYGNEEAYSVTEMDADDFKELMGIV